MRCAAAVTAISDLNFVVIVEPVPINCRSAEHGLANSTETPDFNLVGTCIDALPT